MYRFHLKNSNGQYLYVLDNQVLASADKTPLPNAPDGWDGIGLTWIRSESNLGVFRKVAIDVRFVLDGANILRHLYYASGGINAFATLEIELLNKTSQNYELLESCEVDFSEFKDEDIFVTVNLKDLGLASLIEEKGATEYGIDISTKPMLVEFSGLNVKGYIKWFINTTSATTSLVAADMTLAYRSSNLGKDFVPDNVQSVGDYSVDGAADADSLRNEVIRKYMLKSTHEYTAKITVKNTRSYSTAEAISNGSILFRYSKLGLIRASNIGGVFNGVYRGYNFLFDNTYYDSQTSFIYDERRYADKTYNVDVRLNETLTLALGGLYNALMPSGGSIASFMTFTTGVEQVQRIYAPNSGDYLAQPSIEMDYELVLPKSQAKGMLYIDLIKQILAKMGGSNYIVNSEVLTNTNIDTFNMFDTLPARAVVLSGDSLRSYSESKITASFNSIMQDLWARFGISYGVLGNQIVIERASYFYQNIRLAELTEISGMTMVPYKVIGGTIKVGFDDIDIDDYASKNEVLKQITFDIEALNKIPTETTFIAPFQSAMFALEAVRSGAVNKTSGDTTEERKANKYDSETFVVEVEKFETSILRGYKVKTFPGKYKVGGFDSDRYTNLGYTPMRMIGRNLRYIRSFVDTKLAKQTIEGLDFKSDLNNTIAINVIDERANISLVGDFFAGREVRPLFKPLVFEFECSAPRNFMLSLNNNPYGFVEFKVRGTMVKGYILEAGVTPSSKAPYKFRILSHTDTEYLKLIK